MMMVWKRIVRLKNEIILNQGFLNLNA